MTRRSLAKPNIGDEPPLVADRRRKPDRRRVSLRWLAGTLLTGVTSTALMGIALSGALEGRPDVAVPPSLMVRPAAAAALADVVEKGERVVATLIPLARSRRTLSVSTMNREGDREVIRTQPFAYVTMALGLRHPTSASYPPFDPLAIFEEEADEKGAEEGVSPVIYGTKVESEVTLKVEPFDFSDPNFDEAGVPTAEAAEELVRSVSGKVGDKPLQVASLLPIDSFVVDPFMDASQYEPGSAFRVVTENVSVALPDDDGSPEKRFYEEIVPLREERPVKEVLAESGLDEESSGAAADQLIALMGTDTLAVGNVLRIGVEESGAGSRPVRLSLYDQSRHLFTVAATDSGTFEQATPPAFSAAVSEAFDENATEGELRDKMPTVYDGIYQAALAYGLNDELSQTLLRILAVDVDLQAPLAPDDRLTLLYSLDGEDETVSDDSEILYVEARFGESTQKYYRFRSEDGHFDYYGADGRSAKQFLLRNPVPNGRFTSSFGMRRHPVLGYSRMHWGVDWAAPRGTKILAAGSGVVESAGWTSGFGRHTVIRHANGYETSYSHQSKIADGVVPGARVRQGQVIGEIGSSGLATGNHLHYELMVNGKKVDPMRVRLPSGRKLEGDELLAFERERDRIDKLIQEQANPPRIAGR
ncbi:M23 family metallopeptidase [Consotaella salsifontis]|uniref:Murein DD-endopeptidase MepM and murein hydrolase activator NlpD, contain LysM domain n=1 Tax=Consotaella salsifontis TaxID=1365950 RepID=A0A1T4SCV1_9HYPH|nr:M23 family metallopeptidase [Consotaella salsifontis]SKA25728.1 Murein DD-endopeptidase MepM and murein hydrolase activator NlpD, contain LysM domain [Consotaella salsifontis]